MIQKIKDFLSLFKDKPRWLRILVTVLLSVLVTVYLLSSCGQTVKVTVRDTPSGVSISTSQNKADSSNTSITVNPTINLPSYAKKSTLFNQ